MKSPTAADQQVDSLQEELQQLQEQRAALVAANQRLHRDLDARKTLLPQPSRLDGLHDTQEDIPVLQSLAALLTLCRNLEAAPLTAGDISWTGLQSVYRHYLELVTACENLLRQDHDGGMKQPHGCSAGGGGASGKLQLLVSAAVQCFMQLARLDGVDGGKVVQELHQQPLQLYGPAPEQAATKSLLALALTRPQEQTLLRHWALHQSQLHAARSHCQQAAAALQGQDDIAASRLLKVAAADARSAVEFLYGCVAALTPAQAARCMVAARPWVPDFTVMAQLLEATAHARQTATRL